MRILRPSRLCTAAQRHSAAFAENPFVVKKKPPRRSRVLCIDSAAFASVVEPQTRPGSEVRITLRATRARDARRLLPVVAATASLAMGIDTHGDASLRAARRCASANKQITGTRAQPSYTRSNDWRRAANDISQIVYMRINIQIGQSEEH